MSGAVRFLRFDDTGPDGAGRRAFTMFWVGEDHCRNGLLRGQVFHARPEGYPHDGVVASVEEAAERLGLDLLAAGLTLREARP